MDMLAALYYDDINISSETYFKGRHVYGLDFDEPIIPRKYLRRPDPPKHYSDKITLVEAHHVLGSVQVLVETDDGKRIVYSGDFAYPGTRSIPCDVLVLDATHGDPMFNAPSDTDSLENRLTDCVEQEIEAGRPVCIRAHVGRLQYAMSLLSARLAPNIKFLSAHENLKLVPVYGKYGMPIRNDVVDTNDKPIKSERIFEGGYPFVEFKKTSERKSIHELDDRSAVFYLGGVNLGRNTTIKQSSENKKHYLIEFGDHGTYDGILEYVRKCDPKLVIVDQSRSKWGESLAKKITAELKIEAMAQP